MLDTQISCEIYNGKPEHFKTDFQFQAPKIPGIYMMWKFIKKKEYDLFDLYIEKKNARMDDARSYVPMERVVDLENFVMWVEVNNQNCFNSF